MFNKLFFLFFCGVAIKTVYSSARILFAQRSLKKPATGGAPSPTLPLLRTLRHRVANLRQLQLLTLYLAGFCLAPQALDAYRQIANSSTPLYVLVLIDLRACFVSAYFVFLVFLMIHTLQWIVSVRVNSFADQQT